MNPAVQAAVQGAIERAAERVRGADPLQLAAAERHLLGPADPSAKAWLLTAYWARGHAPDCSACGSPILCAEHRNVVPCPDCAPKLRFTDADIWPDKCTNCGRNDLRMHPSGSGKCWPCGEDPAAPK